MNLKFVTICAFLIVIPAFTHADIGNYWATPETGVIVTRENPDISLQLVDVTITGMTDVKHGDSAVAECKFIFRNNSNQSVKASMGFPILTEHYSYEEGWGRGWLSSFELSIGEKHLVTVVKAESVGLEEIKDKNHKFDVFKYDLPSKHNQFHYIDQININTDNKNLPLNAAEFVKTFYWEYTFRAKEKQHFIVKYQIDNWKHIRYIISTAATWKDCVPSMRIRIGYPSTIPDRFINAAPQNFRHEKNYLLWEFKNYCKNNPYHQVAVDISDDYHEQNQEQKTKTRIISSPGC